MHRISIVASIALVGLVSVVAANAQLAPSKSAPPAAFAPVEQWKAAVLAGDASKLRALYSTQSRRQGCHADGRSRSGDRRRVLDWTEGATNEDQPGAVDAATAGLAAGGVRSGDRIWSAGQSADRLRHRRPALAEAGRAVAHRGNATQCAQQAATAARYQQEHLCSGTQCAHRVSRRIEAGSTTAQARARGVRRELVLRLPCAGSGVSSSRT